jgi:hypothetical protein
MIAWILVEAAAAASPEVIPAGTQVRIEAVSRRDAFWRFRDEIVGMICVVGEPGLERHRRKWHAGLVTCAGAEEYYFYEVEVTPGDYGVDLASLLATAAVEPEPPEEDPTPPVPAPAPARPASPAPPSAWSSDWPVGATGKIRAVSPADETYNRKPSVVGWVCTVVDEPLARSGEGWLSGSLRCDGKDWFFFQVALDPTSAVPEPAPIAAASPAPASAPPALATGAGPSSVARKADGRLTGTPIPAGRIVRVVDISSSDLYFSDRRAWTGKVCTVAEAPLLPTGEGWYAGRLFCGEGAQRQFYQVAVAPE